MTVIIWDYPGYISQEGFPYAFLVWEPKLKNSHIGHLKGLTKVRWGRQILSQIFHELSMPVEVAQVEQSVEKGPEDMSPITQSTSVTPCLGEKSVTGVSEEQHKEIAASPVYILKKIDCK